MDILKLVLVCLIALSSVGGILVIDKPREPKTRGAAVSDIIANALLIWVILS